MTAPMLVPAPSASTSASAPDEVPVDFDPGTVDVGGISLPRVDAIAARKPGDSAEVVPRSAP